ncbi:hypothetical protein FRC17_010864 [Serendipita sp. 399]|nr:hypothetical protein FRC17_010864 [Serendipita sp. 399]
MAPIGTREEIVSAFDSFREELDSNNDRRERIIKLSREITILSKRAIFLLHRIATSDQKQETPPYAGEGETQHAQSDSGDSVKTVETKLQDIRKRLLKQLAVEVPSQTIYWQHQVEIKSITPGIQEYIEAVSYMHFIKTGRLIRYDEMKGWLSDHSGVLFVPLPFDEFLLGVSDLTGELMRFAITSIARGGGRTKAEDVCSFVRKCKADFERFTPYVRELSKKQQTTKQSMQKIEEANYAVRLRLAEFQTDPDLLDEIAKRSIAIPQHRMRDEDNEEDPEMD